MMNQSSYPPHRASTFRLIPLLAGVMAWGVLCLFSGVAKAETGELEVRVLDDASGVQIAARMLITRPNGKPIRPGDAIVLGDHFIINGNIVLKLPTGTYNYVIECGAEYREQSGHFIIERGATDQQVIRLKRFVDMKKLGWWSGDLQIQRPPLAMEALMHAEDLHVGFHAWDQPQPASIKWQTTADGQPYREVGPQRIVAPVLVGSHTNGRLYAFPMSPPSDTIPALPALDAPSSDFLKAVRAAGAKQIAIGEPFAWDLPVWIASQQVSSFVLLGPYLSLSEKEHTALRGHPRDPLRFRGVEGLGRYCEHVYYQLLNCGLRLPPAAATGSGEVPTPAGTERMYVYCGEEFSYEQWWQQFLAGRVVVTNGPILLPRVNGELPGHLFQAPAGEKLTLQPTLTLHTRVRIAYLEIVKNGEVVHEVRLDKLVEKNGELPAIEFDESGWLTIRAVADNTRQYRGVTSGPFYVQIGDSPRISRNSAQFFLDWVYDAARNLNRTEKDEAKRAAAMLYYRAAKSYWEEMVANANAE